MRGIDIIEERVGPLRSLEVVVVGRLVLGSQVVGRVDVY